MPKVRLATINAPSFTELGADNALSPSWREVDTDTFDAHAQDVFEQQVGRIIQVHPDDTDKVKSYNGLELYEGTFRYPGGNDTDKPRIGDRHQAEERAADAPTPTPDATRTRRTATAATGNAKAPTSDASTPVAEPTPTDTTTTKTKR